MCTRFFVIIVASLMAIGNVSIVNADELIINEINRSGSAAAQSPRRGMSMNDVEANWGQPTSKQPAVGDPPITRWEYPGFVVYFEFSHVLHSVQKR